MILSVINDGFKILNLEKLEYKHTIYFFDI